MRRYTVHAGDCRDVMRDYPADHFDSIVSDPPYGLSFMGKGWDRGVPGEEFWREALRVAKPGAHLLAFGGSRTFHRLTVAIEDAGWEVRDVVCWLYATGFPKSLDVSKAIDKRGGNAHLTAKIGAALKAAREARGIGVSEADRTYCGGVTLWSWYEGRPAGQQMPTAEVMSKIAKDWPELQCYADAIEEAEREVIGTKSGSLLAVAPGQTNDRGATLLDLTAPATAAAQQWSGWGTALKPAWEPVIVARKPLDGTVAANVTRYGTGALNIDGCRVGDATGRWPANVMHDGSAEVVAGFPVTGPAQASMRGDRTGVVMDADWGGPNTLRGHNDAGGSAARFFYCAKASRADREEGCDHLPARTGAEAVDRDDDTAGLQSPRAGAGRTADTVRNFHPTVKPTDLMRYLCRLVTPPDGLVLDPFCGSGSTGKGALLEGFRFVGIDLDPAHVAIAEARCQFAVDTVDAEAAAAEAPGAQLTLF